MNCRSMDFLTIVVFLMTGIPADAQAPNSDSVLFDPPETKYFTGALDNDPDDERGLPTTEQYRAFLPRKIDLSSRMPPVGHQGQIQSCQAWATAYAARSYYTSALERRDIMQPANLPSPSYVYHLARTDNNCGEGSTIVR